jgi:hypothetical protein
MSKYDWCRYMVLPTVRKNMNFPDILKATSGFETLFFVWM